MENEYPSTYDIIATPIGGMALGEVTYEVEPKALNAQGDRSRAILHAVGLRLDLKLRKQLYLTSTFMNYTRDTKYRYHANVFSNTSEGRIMLTINIDREASPLPYSYIFHSHIPASPRRICKRR